MRPQRPGKGKYSKEISFGGKKSYMAKVRIINLAKELKVDVRELMQHLKDDLGLKVDNYLSSLDEAMVDRVRQTITQIRPQVEEVRVGETVKRRRRVAPAATVLREAAPEEAPLPLPIIGAGAPPTPEAQEG